MSHKECCDCGEYLEIAKHFPKNGRNKSGRPKYRPFCYICQIGRDADAKPEMQPQPFFPNLAPLPTWLEPRP